MCAIKTKNKAFERSDVVYIYITACFAFGHVKIAAIQIYRPTDNGDDISKVFYAEQKY